MNGRCGCHEPAVFGHVFCAQADRAEREKEALADVKRRMEQAISARINTHETCYHDAETRENWHRRAHIMPVITP